MDFCRLLDVELDPSEGNLDPSREKGTFMGREPLKGQMRKQRTGPSFLGGPSDHTCLILFVVRCSFLKGVFGVWKMWKCGDYERGC